MLIHQVTSCAPSSPGLKRMLQTMPSIGFGPNCFSQRTRADRRDTNYLLTLICFNLSTIVVVSSDQKITRTVFGSTAPTILKPTSFRSAAASIPILEIPSRHRHCPLLFHSKLFLPLQNTTCVKLMPYSFQGSIVTDVRI